MKKKVNTYRLLGVLLALDVVCLVASGILKNQKHGAGSVIGTISWIGFLVGTLVLVLLASAVLIRSARERRTSRLAA